MSAPAPATTDPPVGRPSNMTLFAAVSAFSAALGAFLGPFTERAIEAPTGTGSAVIAAGGPLILYIIRSMTWTEPPKRPTIAVAGLVFLLASGCVSFSATSYRDLANEAMATSDLTECALHGQAVVALSEGDDSALSIPAIGFGGDIQDVRAEHETAQGVCEEALARGPSFAPALIDRLNVAWDSIWTDGLRATGGAR